MIEEYLDGARTDNQNLRYRVISRQIARSVDGMPFREAAFLIEKALDFVNIELDPHAPDEVVDQAYRKEAEWINGLDTNSRRIVQGLQNRILISVADKMRNDRREGPRDRRNQPW